MAIVRFDHLTKRKIHRLVKRNIFSSSSIGSCTTDGQRRVCVQEVMTFVTYAVVSIGRMGLFLSYVGVSCL